MPFVRMLLLAVLLGPGAGFLTAQAPALENDPAATPAATVANERIVALEAKVVRLETERLLALETKISRMDQKIERASSTGLVLFLFGAFCALWAQNTGRSAFTWFVLGALFNVITVLVLLSKNSSDRSRSRFS